MSIDSFFRIPGQNSFPAFPGGNANTASLRFWWKQFQLSPFTKKCPLKISCWIIRSENESVSLTVRTLTPPLSGCTELSLLSGVHYYGTRWELRLQYALCELKCSMRVNHTNSNAITGQIQKRLNNTKCLRRSWSVLNEERMQHKERFLRKTWAQRLTFLHDKVPKQKAKTMHDGSASGQVWLFLRGSTKAQSSTPKITRAEESRHTSHPDWRREDLTIPNTDRFRINTDLWGEHMESEIFQPFFETCLKFWCGLAVSLPRVTDLWCSCKPTRLCF